MVPLFECRICRELFDQPTLRRHLATVHVEYACHVCKECVFQAYRTEEAKEHADETKHTMTLYYQVSGLGGDESGNR